MLFYIIYHMPLWMPIAIIIVSAIMWPLIMIRLSAKNHFLMKLTNRILTIIAITGVLAITILNRSKGNNEVILSPFHSFIEAKIQPELYREMLMNVFLFFPFGLCFPYSLKTSRKMNVVITITVAFLLSVGVEAFQFIFSCGRCETDDVICNTLGALIGSVSFIFYIFTQRESSV